MATDAGVKNVSELRTFGKQIQQMGEQMYNVMSQAQRRMNQVCEGWHDDTNDKFKTRFDESVRTIHKMSEEEGLRGMANLRSHTGDQTGNHCGWLDQVGASREVMTCGPTQRASVSSHLIHL